MLASVPRSGNGPAARVAAFMAHLRGNGFAVGPGETELALDLLTEGGLATTAAARLGFKVMLCGSRAEWERFDALFDAFWLGRGVKRAARAEPAGGGRGEHRAPRIWDDRLGTAEGTAPLGPTVRSGGDDEHGKPREGAGRLVASRREALSRADLRRLVSEADRAEAERIAERLANAMRYRLSRRRLPARRGDAIDFRRTLRRNLPRGGEPVELLRRRRPERPVNLVVLLDVSGSMQPYSRYFLAFLRGLVARWLRADAFLFHTRLIRVTPALRERDPARAMDRLALMAEGFGGGTRIAGALAAFNERYAKEVLHSRSVVIVMSDGYDTDPPETLERELVRLKRRARRLIWLNPLIAWRDYAPVARAMAAALPYVDCFATAHSLDSLAALEGELARL